MGKLTRSNTLTRIKNSRVEMNLRNFCAALALAMAMGAAHATFTVDFVQSGADVVVTGNGTIDLSGMADSPGAGTCGFGFGAIDANALCIGTGGTGKSYNAAFTAPVSGLNTAGGIAANSGGGPMVVAVANQLWLPAGYVSGSAIANSSTYNGITLAGLGLTDGAVHTINLVSGDSIVIRVGSAVPAAVVPTTPASIPTLGEYGLLVLVSLMAMIGISAVRRTRSSD